MKIVRNFLKNIYKKYFFIEPITELKRKGLVVGKNFNMQGGVSIDSSHCWHICIGDNVTLAPNVVILAHDASTKMFINHTKIGKIILGNRVFIGACSIILPGVKIGNDVVVAAGSVVNRDIPNGVVVAGNPAKIVGKITDFINRKKSEMKVFPCFGNEFTERGGVTDEKKKKMNEMMKEGFGYII
jgi:maltose O-acetyltransferase